MTKRRTLLLLSNLALAAFVVFEVLISWHYGNIPEVLNEQNRAQWLARRDSFQWAAIISVVTSAILFIGGLTVGRPEPKPNKPHS